jgi:hypothetical protein
MKPQWFVVVVFLLFCSSAKPQKAISSANDTTIVGRILSTDSTLLILNADRFGNKFYYGLYHLKIGAIDVSKNTISDTLIVVYVYNKRSEIKEYLNGFNLKVGQDYIFDLSIFSPCHSDLHRLEGQCQGDNYFVPFSNKLIKRYSEIYRIINITPWK